MAGEITKPLKSKTFYANETIGLSIARWPYRQVNGQNRPGKISIQIVHHSEVDGQKKTDYSKSVFFTPNDTRRVADWLSQWAYEQDVENDSNYREMRRKKLGRKTSSYGNGPAASRTDAAPASSLSSTEIEEILFAMYRGENTILSKIRAALEEKEINIPVTDLRNLLEKLKEEGKVIAEERTAKQGHKYTVWTFKA
ncbi:MAG: hypothetical protein ACTSP4_10070 [Candidatus Hodarchaeales archaeon]